MVRPIHSEGLGTTNNRGGGPRVHFSPVVSQLRYKEQQGSLRPVSRQRVNYKNPENNTGVLNGGNFNPHNGQVTCGASSNNTGSGGRVTVHVQEMFLPSPTVQKTEMHRQNGIDNNSGGINNGNKSYNNTLLLDNISEEVNVPVSSSSFVMDCSASCRTDDGGSRINNFSGPLRNNSKQLNRISNGGNHQNRTENLMTLESPEVNIEPCTSSKDFVTPLPIADFVGTHRTVYGYEYYGYTYGLPSPAESTTAVQQRQSLPNTSGGLYSDIYNNYCSHPESRFSCCSSTTAASTFSAEPQQQQRQQRATCSNYAPNRGNNVVKCVTVQQPNSETSSPAAAASCCQTPGQFYGRPNSNNGIKLTSKLVQCVPEQSGGVKVDKEKTSKKFNLLRKLSFGKLGGGRSSSDSKSKKWRKKESTCPEPQVVSLSSWPSIKKGVVVSHNNRESLVLQDSPVIQSCSACAAELCQGRRRRVNKGARNAAAISPPSISSSNGSEDNANNRLFNLETRDCNVNGVVRPVNFPVKVNRNCLCIPREEINDRFPKNATERSGIIDGNAGFLPVGNNSAVYIRRNNRAFDRNFHLGNPCEGETSNVPCSDSSVSEFRIPPSFPNAQKFYEFGEHKSVIDGSGQINRKDEICDTEECDADASCSKNVATSPIHHLSAAFHALNLSAVPNKTSVEHLDNLEPAPTPPPRPKRKKSDASTAEEKLLQGRRQIDEEFNYSVSSTDELSANVDKILDEIVNLELECLSMELYASLHQQQQQQHEQKMDHLRDGGSDRENSKIKSFSSTRAERGGGRMGCGGDEETSSRRVVAADLEEGRVTPNSVFGKPPRPPTARNNTSAIRQQFLLEQGEDLNMGIQKPGTRSGTGVTATELDVKLLKFRLQLYRSREELAKSHPNLEEMEELVRSSMVIDRSRSQRTLPPLSVYDGGSSSSRTNSGKPEIPPTAHTTATFNISSPSPSATAGQFLQQRLTPDPVTSEKERSRAQEWNKLVNQVNQNLQRKSKFNSVNNSSHNGNAPGQTVQFTPIVETDLDTGTSREIVNGRTSKRQLYFETYGEQYNNDDEWSEIDICRRQETAAAESRKRGTTNHLPLSVYPDHDGHLSYSLNHQKTQSMLNLGSPTSTVIMSSHREKSATLTPTTTSANVAEGSLSVTAPDDRARSMEFLLDDSDKNSHLRPPENNLMMRQEQRQLSEHEVRIQRSLNKLNVPDWYKDYAKSGGGGGGGGTTATTTSSTSKSKIFGSGSGLAGGWTGLSSSKTSSLTSLQSTGRYSGRSHFSRLRSTGTASTGGRSSRESLMSPSSTASASPSPYYERSSFTYGMPYALTRFASARMSCGASPASLSPSPSPVGGVGGGGGSSTSTPVSSAPLSRHHSYSKTPYLGWRSQERLNTKQLYRSPAERLAADLLAQKSRTSSPVTVSVSGVKDEEKDNSSGRLDTPSKESSPKKETASASDLSLNNSEESNSHKLNRVRCSIKAVSNAIVDYVNDSKPLDDGINGSTSPRRFVWLESSFVGTKPIDSPGTPDTPTVIMTSASRQLAGTESGSSSSIGGGSSTTGRPRNVFRFEDDHHHHHPSSMSRTGGGSAAGTAAAASAVSPLSHDSTLTSSSAKNNGTSTTNSSTYNPYHSRNEQMEERSNSSSVSSPTLDDILDSLLALRRPHKKVKPRSISKGHSKDPAVVSLPPSQLDPTPVSDWQERMNQPVLDTLYFPVTDDFFPSSTTITTTTTVVQSASSSSANDYLHHNSFNISSDTTVTTAYNSNNSPSDADTALGHASSITSRTEEYDPGSNYLSNTFSYGDKAVTAGTTRKTSEQHQWEAESLSNKQAAEQSSNSNNSNNAELSVEKNGKSSSGYKDGTDAGDDEDNDDENAFGIPTEIYTASAAAAAVASSSISSSAAVNAIASLNDSNPPTPARHRRVSFDLDVSDKEEKSSSRSIRKDESVGGAIHCRNTKCTKAATGLEARREFKTCHNCNAYYCSRECRRAHWEKHKKVCMQSRVGALCKQIINHVKEDSFVVSQLSSVARRGYLAKGRGCVKLFFSSPDRAERFLTGGLPELPEPWYIPCADILPEEMGAQTFAELSDQCRTYNGDNRFVLYVSVCVVNEVPTSGAVKWEREMISRSAKLRLLLPRNYEETQMHHQAASQAHLFPDEPIVPAHHSLNSPDNSTSESSVPPPTPPHGSDNDTLILRSVPAPTTRELNQSEDKKLREVSFANIQKHLVERGVDLRRTFPDIYSKLCNYVEYDEPFLPVTIYPKNNNTGRQFVCVIMPDPSSNHHAHEDYTSAESGTSTSGSRTFETVNISENNQSEFQ